MFLFFLKMRRPPISPLFPYTALFRSLLIASLESAGVGRSWLVGEEGAKHEPVDRVLDPPSPSRERGWRQRVADGDRKSTRLNSSHANISYAVFCLKKKNNHGDQRSTR